VFVQVFIIIIMFLRKERKDKTRKENILRVHEYGH